MAVTASVAEVIASRRPPMVRPPLLLVGSSVADLRRDPGDSSEFVDQLRYFEPVHVPLPLGPRFFDG